MQAPARTARGAAALDIPGLSCPALQALDDATRGTHTIMPGTAAGTDGLPLAASVAPASPQPSVLVVEPDPNRATHLAGQLRRAGFEVCTASDGMAALYGLRHHRPDVVVLNLDLPLVSGFRLVHLLKGDREGPLPVVVMTTLSFEEAWEAIRAGADDFLELPCAPQEIVSRVQYLLSRKASPAAAPPFPNRSALVSVAA